MPENAKITTPIQDLLTILQKEGIADIGHNSDNPDHHYLHFWSGFCGGFIRIFQDQDKWVISSDTADYKTSDTDHLLSICKALATPLTRTKVA